ncbi:hypothetical protein BC941DRAFT_431140 [Chlamydoabsidia padenii]|nr:hypothetical protein BC941DRAFT_431140 [Chlamydoabsidia padenii]
MGFQQRPGSNKKNGYDPNYKPTPGSVLPGKIKDELDELDPDHKDTRKFTKKYVNKAANRKELRKQKRSEKGQRRQEYQQHVHAKIHQTNKRKQQPQPVVAEKRQKVTTPPPKNTDNTQALQKLAKTNPNLYSLLSNDELSGGSKTTDDAFAEDDQYIAYWEKKLKMNKTKKFGKAFEDDGLLDVLGDLASTNTEQGSEMDDMEYLLQKRLAKKKQDAENAMDDLFEGLESEEEEEEEEDDDDSEDDDIDMGMEESEVDDDGEEDNDKESEETPKVKPTSTATPVTTTSSAATKYIPPHLRKKATTKTEQQLRLQRQLQGLLNKLSESNMESILLDIEKLYSDYSRNDVNTIITELILTSIAQKSNLLDSFVITYATIVGSLYRLIGIEFVAYFVQTLVETFEKNYKSAQTAIASGEDQGEDGPEGAKEAKNLLTLTLELYNFQVISCILVYDLVRLLIENMDEQAVELLLKIVKTSGAQMRADDPASLKDIIDEIQKQSNKKDPAAISIRHKFMLETIINVKNNKFKSGEMATRQSDKEMVTKMKKFLNGLGKKRTVRSAEPLRVSLDDIHQIDTKGKWWLVGASWKANLVGTESEHAKKTNSKLAADLKKDQSLQVALLKLARKQGMNTDIRRSIFVSIMSAEDYLDAFEKLMKLALSEVQQREIPRVLLQCTGNEKTFNPYYAYVSQRLCQLNHSYRVTYQYCLWDFLRDLGQSEVGGLDRAESSLSGDKKNIRISRIVNVAKFYAQLLSSQTLSLTILRTINFVSLTRESQVFLDVLLANLLLLLQSNHDDLKQVFLKVAHLPTLSQGLLLHIQGSLLQDVNRTGLSEDSMQVVHDKAQLVKIILKTASASQSSSTSFD